VTTDTLFDIDVDALERRILAAIWDAAAPRFEVEFEWPECHKPKCSHRHGSPDAAFGIMKHVIADAVRLEIRYHATTRPDVAKEDDSPEDVATYTLAALLNRYNVHHAGTFVKAARLIVDAYPAIVPALTGGVE
jgi:hypothetical protein